MDAIAHRFALHLRTHEDVGNRSARAGSESTERDDGVVIPNGAQDSPLSIGERARSGRSRVRTERQHMWVGDQMKLAGRHCVILSSLVGTEKSVGRALLGQIEKLTCAGRQVASLVLNNTETTSRLEPR